MTRDFQLDEFQLRSIESLDRGHSVIVAAPTGAGKTVVAEHAVALALERQSRAFYTTPIKALSNQKFRDLRSRHGDDAVGLMTGDNVIAADAPVIVMTTEVLRNMLYAGSSALDRLEYVVLDEVHYLQDAYRGPVWEEVIVHLPAQVRLACLSATVSNAEELAEWISLVRGPTDLVVEHRRPVELRNLYLVGDRSAERDHLIPTLVDGKANPEGERFDDQRRNGGAGNGRRRGRGPRRRWHTPRRVPVVERLADEDMLPAIVFVFSRAGCDEAVRTVMQSGIRLAEASQAGRIREIAERHTAALSGTDLEILGYERWLRALENGVAAHHAGMVPAFKEAVEEAFTEGLVKVVFATETLALGVNMPARSVVIENLSKFTGETHELLTPSQYTQLTGRAGRRGIDELGHAIVLWSPYVGFDQVAALAASRSFRLTSAFRPNYNMAANLVRRHERDEALRLLRQSFAQFQTDRVVVAAERRQVRRRERMAQLETVLAGPGDLEEYVELRRRADTILAADQDRPDRIEEDLAALRPGDLVLFEGHRAAVISVAFRRGTPQVRLLVPSGGIVTRTAGDLTEPLEPRGTIELPEPYAPNNNGFLHETAIRLRRARLAGARPGAQAVLAPVDQAVLDHQVDQGGDKPLERHGLFDPGVDLHLDVEARLRVDLGRQLEDLLEGRHRRARQVAPRRLREPPLARVDRTAVEPANLGQGQVAKQRPLVVGQRLAVRAETDLTRQPAVVRDDDNAVGGDAGIDLEGGDAQLERPPERRQGVLRQQPPRPPVPLDVERCPRRPGTAAGAGQAEKQNRDCRG